MSDRLFVGDGEIAALMREADWASSPIGPPETWPQSIHALIRMMLTSRYAMWMGWGPDLTFFYNDAYGRMTLGAKHPWALGRPAAQVWAEVWPDVKLRVRQVLETGEATWDEGLLLFLERNGYPEETYHTFSYSPVHDDEGRIVGMFCVVTEETSRVIGNRRLDALRELSVRLSGSQTIDDVWGALRGALTQSKDVPFALAYTLGENRTATLSASSNIPEGHQLLAPEIDVIAHEWPLHAVATGERASEVVPLRPDVAWPTGPWQNTPEYALVLPIAEPGQSAPAGLLVAGLNPYRPFDAEYRSFLSLLVGQLSAGLGAARAYDMERRRAEALAHLDRVKTAFFSNASHELRTPLTLILGPVADALLSDQRALSGDALELLYRNALRLRRLVNGLLDFSRLEAGRVDAHFELVDLGALTSELAAAFRSAIEQAGLMLIVDAPSDDGPTYVDRSMWEKVVLNLLSNALKFTLSGEIRISLRRVGDAMRLTVADTGIGIPSQEVPRIFERFHRVVDAAGRTNEGTGIGLALVEELVKLHGGRISVESTPGAGTTFTIDVPTGSAHLPSGQVKARRAALASDTGAEAFVQEALHWLPDEHRGEHPLEIPRPGDARFQGPLIVVADDNADMRSYLRSLLGARWRVLTASSGLEALELATEWRPDLVIADVMMPRMDGFELLRRLRGDERTQHTAVIMLSARAGEEARVEGIEAGADDYLVKPFSGRELVARVDANLRLARAGRERLALMAREAEARRETEYQKQDFQSLLMLAPTPITLLRGRDFVIEVANPFTCELWRRPLHDVIDRPLFEAIPELEAQPFREMLERVYNSGEPHVDSETPVVFARSDDGQPHTTYMNFVFTPLRDATGQVDRILAVGSDVTSQVTARHEISSLREVAETANRAKDEFLAMLGHELRNPLAPILTALQLMKLRAADAVKAERAVIERQVTHLVALVDDLLDVSRITRGKIELRRAPLEIADVLARAIEVSSPLLEQQGHDLQVAIPATGLTVNADGHRLEQVISNLLNNAAKYTEPGGQIHVSADADEGHVVIRVRDTGVGIEPDMLPRIFDLFAQARQSLDRSRGGLGIGLALVRSIVELHGGSVAAASAGKGQGALFTVRLPLITAAVADDPARGGEPTTTRQLHGGRVLIVDDNRDAAVLLGELLRTYGCETVIAHDGPSALAATERFVPDLAILDIGLPVMDGYELAGHLRRDARLAGIRLIAVTGYGQTHDRERSRAAGFDAHLVKPVSDARLRDAMSREVPNARATEQ